jgi:predicted flap endonuclease-1-like 5' DNA nuclease
MTWFIGQSMVIIAAAFLLGILVGWLIWGRILRPKQADSVAQEQKPVAAPEPVVVEAAVEPEPEVQPEPVVVEAAAEPEPEMQPDPEVRAEPEPVAEEEPEPAVVVAQAAAPEIEVIPDDLERIEGIGPKMAGALVKSGIRTYAQLATADQGALRQAIESDGLRFAPSLVTWSRQARLLADGDEAGFEDLTRRLVAGRDEGRE